jgi:hypothetical protein
MNPDSDASGPVCYTIVRFAFPVSSNRSQKGGAEETPYWALQHSRVQGTPSSARKAKQGWNSESSGRRIKRHRRGGGRETSGTMRNGTGTGIDGCGSWQRSSCRVYRGVGFGCVFDLGSSVRLCKYGSKMFQSRSVWPWYTLSEWQAKQPES